MWVSKVAQLVKNLPDNARDTRDAISFPGLGRSPGVGKVTCSSIPAWEIPWTEEPGGLQSMGLQRVGHDRVTKNTAQHNPISIMWIIQTS